MFSDRHTHVDVDSDHPFSGIDPKEYEQDIIATVRYVGAGENTPNDNRQIIKKIRSVTVDSVTKEILSILIGKLYKRFFCSNNSNY